MAKDVGEQADLFNEQDLFAGQATAEDGPGIDCPAEDGEKDEGAHKFDFNEKCDALLDDLILGPQKHKSQSGTTASEAKEAAHSSSRRPMAAQRAAAKAEQSSSSGSCVHHEKTAEVSDIKPRKGGVTRTKKTKNNRQRDCVLYWLETKYDVLPEVIQAFSEALSESGPWQEAAGPDDDMDLLWSDGAISVERFIKMQSYQKINHFVGMTSITRKNNLGRNLLRMKKKFPDEYRFFPDTWILPTDLSDFKMQFNGKKNKTFIVKPSDGYQGKGIFLTRDFESIALDYNSTMVVQRYVHKPWLLDGFKFDLRLYVLVTGCDPLRIFLHEHGLVRLASEEYVEPKGKNLQRSMVHLTNYAINCDNPNFEENHNPEDGSDGHKRSLQAVLREFEEAGVDVPTMMAQIEDLIVKTLVAVQPSLSHVYHSCQPDDVDNAMCFEILGFDVLLDCNAKPWLIEVNHAPSFRSETDLDRLVKFQVLYDAFELLNISPESRRRYKREQQQALENRARGVGERRSLEERQLLEEDAAKVRTTWEATIKNGFKPLYPVTDERAVTYERCLETAIDIWETMTGSNSRRKPKKDVEEETANRRGGSDRGDRSKVAARRQNSQAGGMAPAKAAAAASAAADSGRSSSSRRSRSAEKLGAAGVAAAAALGTKMAAAGSPPSTLPGVANTSKPAPVSSKHGDVEVGDLIQVQTNLGWEGVTVARKHDTGQLDIKFEDGEIMTQVMPRILKRANGSPIGERANHLPSTSTSNAQQRPDSHGSPSYLRGAHSPEHRQGARSPGMLPQQPPPPPTRPPPMFDKNGNVGAAVRGGASASSAGPRPINGGPQPRFSAAVSAAIASAVAVAAAAGGTAGSSRPSMVAAGFQAPASELTGPSCTAGPPTAASIILQSRGAAASTAPSSSAGDRSPMAVVEAEGHSSASNKWSPLHPPPRLRWGTTDASSPSASVGGAGGERCTNSATAGITDAGLQDCDPSLRRKIRQALRDESLHRLRQKLLAENGNSALTPPERRAAPADLSAEARAKNRARVRPLLPPKGPGWSTACGSANMTYRPALTIEARGVHPGPPGSAGRRRDSTDGAPSRP